MKVIVVGASISGLFTAYLLAKEGVDVEVYEKGGALGWPPRTLIVTNKISEILDFAPEEAILNKIRYIELFSRSRSARLELVSPDLVVEREKLVNLLARLAKGTGAKIVLKHLSEGFGQFGRKIVVTLKNLETGEEYRRSTDILIGADGALSAVSRAVSRNGHHLAALVQARVLLPEEANGDTLQVRFNSDQTKYFYWLIPESNHIGAVGLITDNVKEADTSLMAFLKERKLETLQFQAAMVPMHHFEWLGGFSTPGRNVFVVGDAAGQVKVTTVGGVVTGLYGARALATAVLNGRNYRKELAELKLELDLHLLVRRVLNWFNEKDYDQLIGMLDGGLKDILQERTRDELSNSFLSLILKEPRLIALGAKAYLRSILGN